MSFYKKSFDFFGKMNNNKNFYIFNTTSPTDSSEIISKFEKYETAPEIFRHYSNNDIKRTFKSIENLENLYSSLYNEKKTNILKSKIDIYISTLSNIFLLSNLIAKNKLILNKAIDKTKENLNIFYIENKINKNIKKKINNYILNLLGITNKKIKRKKNLLLLNNNNRFNTFEIEKPNISILTNKNNNINTEIKIIEHSINNYSLNQEKTINITNQTDINNKMFEDNLKLDIRTPTFKNENIDSYMFKKQIINNNDIDKLNENNAKKDSLKLLYNNNNNEDLNKNFLKRESIHSYYTLASHSNSKEENQKANSKFKVLIQDEINDINIDINRNKNLKKSSKYLIPSINYYNNKNIEVNNEIINKSKCQNFSSHELKTRKEKEMLKNLLAFINNLFKKEIINYEEKKKLKQLIIIKSEKLENIYSVYYENKKDELIIELKKLLN